MDIGLLGRLMGEGRWTGPCVVVLDADASLKAPGPDTIMGGGIKQYAPRYSSGRIEADAAYLLTDANALLLVQQQVFKDATGLEYVRQTLTVADVPRVAAVEFAHLGALKALGVPAPRIETDGEYRAGTLVG
jgi:hypothetical protein